MGEDLAQLGCERIRLAGLAVLATEEATVIAGEAHRRGPEALGGTQTVLAVHVETMPTHIASLPVAVNIECHAHRTGSRVI